MSFLLTEKIIAYKKMKIEQIGYTLSCVLLLYHFTFCSYTIFIPSSPMVMMRLR